MQRYDFWAVIGKRNVRTCSKKESFIGYSLYLCASGKKKYYVRGQFINIAFK